MPRDKRYFTELFGASALYVAAIFASVWLLKTYEFSGAVTTLIALLPVPPVALIVLAIIRRVSRLDEMQQRIEGQAAVVSALVVGFGSFTYGLLEENAGFPHLPLIWVLPVLIVVYGLASHLVRRRYQ